MIRIWILIFLGLVLFPPWSLLPAEEGTPLFLGHGWLWAPPLVGGPVGIDFRVLGLEVIGLVAVFALIAMICRLRKGKGHSPPQSGR